MAAYHRTDFFGSHARGLQGVEHSRYGQAGITGLTVLAHRDHGGADNISLTHLFSPVAVAGTTNQWSPCARVSTGWSQYKDDTSSAFTCANTRTPFSKST